MHRIDEEQKGQEIYPYQGNSRKGRILGGLVFIAVGSFFLARQMGILFPPWLFSWPMILVVLGLFIGFTSDFRNFAGPVLILLGLIFLSPYFFPALNLKKFFWPVIFIGIGLLMIFSPGRRSRFRGKLGFSKPMGNSFVHSGQQEGEVLEATSVFGRIRKNILSKNFMGGEVTCVFGNAEIDLLNADIQGTVKLELTQVFGSTKLLVPRNWLVKSELNAVVGDIGDLRGQQQTEADMGKTLVLTGTSVFGDISIRNY